MIRYDTPTQSQNAVTAASLGELTPDQQTRLNQITGRIKQRHRSQIQSILDTGQDLLKAKGMLGHGAFVKWLESEFDWSRRSAYNYMNAARQFGGKFATVANLSPTAIYELSAPSTPDDVRDRLVRRIEKGERVTADQVKELAIKAKKSDNATDVRDNGIEVMDEPRQPGIADTKPVEIDATAELVSSRTIHQPSADAGVSVQADKPSQPVTVSNEVTTNENNVTDVAERIRRQRHERVVSMLLSAVGPDAAQELVYFFNEGEWNAQELFDDLVGRLREGTKSARPAV